MGWTTPEELVLVCDQSRSEGPHHTFGGGSSFSGFERAITGHPDKGELSARVQFRLADDGRFVVWQLRVHPIDPGGSLTEASLRAFPLNEAEAAANGPDLYETLVARLDEERTGPRREFDEGTPPKLRRRRPSGKLPVPEGRKYPDGFYRRVAVEYSRLVASGVQRPAPVIAEANDVPVSTVHRWVKEARRRDLLPAGRVGKAG